MLILFIHIKTIDILVKQSFSSKELRKSIVVILESFIRTQKQWEDYQNIKVIVFKNVNLLFQMTKEGK